jgi:phosphohistidine swiveling domain-containing protein
MQSPSHVRARSAETALTLSFDQIDRGDVTIVGAKGANLGAMARANIPVPPGFCVTNAAFDLFTSALTAGDALFAALDALDATDIDAARVGATAMRDALDALAVPAPVVRAINDALDALGAEVSLAVRSSATAEDLPGASFAGQQDTYLNVRGRDALVDAVRRCWISLFTDRAVLYRSKNGFGHRSVKLCVVVQQMIDAEVSGIMFTADPLSGHRETLSIDAGFGLGEALVSGLISADLYRYDRKAKRVTLARVGDKAFAIRSDREGGTFREPLEAEMRAARALSDEQVHALAAIAERVEALYGHEPQDIEWCIRDGVAHVLQARPITTLFPRIEQHGADQTLRVYVSFGHVQMMLDPMSTMARDLWKFFFPVGKGPVPVLGEPARRSPVARDAACRLFLDVTGVLESPRTRAVALSVIGHVYRDVGLSIEALTRRAAFVEDPWALTDVASGAAALFGPVVGRVPYVWIHGDAAQNAADVDRDLDALQREIRQRILGAPEGSERVRRIAHEFNAFFASVRPQGARIIAGILAHRALARLAEQPWADGVRDEVTALLRGLPLNVTTEMDLAVGDLSDRARQSRAVVALLRANQAGWTELRTALEQSEGGPAFLQALDAFLERYGDRGIGEIDVARPRWRDDPSVLLRAVSGGLADERETGSHRRQHAQQVAHGEAAVKALVEAAGRGPLGAPRRRIVARLCAVARAGMGLREHPKFTMVRVFGTVRTELLRAGKSLTDRGQTERCDDVFHLNVDELAAALDDPSRDLRALVRARRDELEAAKSKRPPLVVSSEGETPLIEVDRTGLSERALVGTPASAGVVEGIARVVRDPEREVLESGEILVAAYTDPGWTPLFVHAAGLVTEVGGLMTHGAVVAREYGIAAVVSVAGATERIVTGQRIRVDGTRGVVEVLEKSQ